MIPYNIFGDLARVERKSAEKYKRDWHDGMLFSHCYKKIGSHLRKHREAGKGNGNNGKGVHHLIKVIWYCIAIMWMEEFRPDFDDRVKPNKPKPKPKKKRRTPQPKPDC